MHRVLVALSLSLVGCQAQWGAAVRPPPNDPVAGEAHLGDAEMGRLEALRESVRASLTQVERRLESGPDEDWAERRLHLTVALAELDAAIERRARALQLGVDDMSNDDIPDDLEQLLARAARSVTAARERQESDASKAPVPVGPGAMPKPSGDAGWALEEERPAEAAEDAEGDADIGGKREDKRKKRKSTQGGRGGNAAPAAARVLADDAPPPDVMSAVERDIARLNACFPPAALDETVILEVTARLASPGRLRGARVVATPPLAPAVTACIADALHAVVVPADREDRLVRFQLTVGR